MPTTRGTLLERVRDPEDARAWEQFFALYAPLLESYARALGLRAADSEEIRDQCLATVVQRISDFRYERRRGSFKGWLHRIARDKVVDWMRKPREERAATAIARAIPDENGAVDAVWEREWRAEHVRYALGEVRRDEDADGRELLDLVLDEDLDAAEIASRTGLNTNQVYKARARFLARMREVLEELGEEG
jgi:RNA polymerase sigma-70 factor (ECF subfamily)